VRSRLPYESAWEAFRILLAYLCPLETVSGTLAVLGHHLIGDVIDDRHGTRLATVVVIQRNATSTHRDPAPTSTWQRSRRCGCCSRCATLSESRSQVVVHPYLPHITQDAAVAHQALELPLFWVNLLVRSRRASWIDAKIYKGCEPSGDPPQSG
jgi:hypothetical protein